MKCNTRFRLIQPSSFYCFPKILYIKNSIFCNRKNKFETFWLHLKTFSDNNLCFYYLWHDLHYHYDQTTEKLIVVILVSLHRIFQETYNLLSQDNEHWLMMLMNIIIMWNQWRVHSRCWLILSNQGWDYKLFKITKRETFFFGIRLINNYGIPAIDNHPAPNFRN